MTIELVFYYNDLNSSDTSSQIQNLYTAAQEAIVRERDPHRQMVASEMSGLLRRLRQLFKKGEQGRSTHTFSLDNRLNLSLREIAREQHRDQRELFDEVLRAGVDEILQAGEYAASWDTLSPREQEVAALICLGLSSYEIAETLSISYDTVRSHSKQVYRKFGLNRKQVRQALRDWRFAEWWENHQQ